MRSVQIAPACIVRISAGLDAPNENEFPPETIVYASSSSAIIAFFSSSRQSCNEASGRVFSNVLMWFITGSLGFERARMARFNGTDTNWGRKPTPRQLGKWISQASSGHRKADLTRRQVRVDFAKARPLSARSRNVGYACGCRLRFLPPASPLCLSTARRALFHRRNVLLARKQLA